MTILFEVKVIFGRLRRNQVLKDPLFISTIQPILEKLIKLEVNEMGSSQSTSVLRRCQLGSISCVIHYAFSTRCDRMGTALKATHLGHNLTKFTTKNISTSILKYIFIYCGLFSELYQLIQERIP